MAMTTSKKQGQSQKIETRVSTFITADMVLDLYDKAKKSKGKEKKDLMERVVFLSQNLNHYTPITLSQYQV
jgi:precorrin-3B methylase